MLSGFFEFGYLLLLVFASSTLLCGLAGWAFNFRFFNKLGRKPRLIKCPGISVIVPVKGADEHTESNLVKLVLHANGQPLQVIVAMEEKSDPAYDKACRVKERFPWADISIVLSGCSAGRMAKVHNMSAGYNVAKYDYIGFMDADVVVNKTSLLQACQALADSATGAVSVVPCYEFPVDAGSALVGIYANYYYIPLFIAVTEVGGAAILNGGFMVIKRADIVAIGGLERFANHISDDASLGRAIHDRGRKVQVLPNIVTMPQSQTEVPEALRQLLKWFIIGRGFLGPFFVGYLSMFPIMLSVLLLLVSWVLGRGLGYPAGLLAASLVFRVGGAVWLDKKIHGNCSALWVYPLIPIFEICLAPYLWIRAVFCKYVVWKGKKYRLEKNGRVTGVGS